MPVKIIRREAEAPKGKKDAPAPAEEEKKKHVIITADPTVEGRPKLSKVMKVGVFEIFPDLDVGDVSGKVKFLVHFTKPGICYAVKDYDDTKKTLLLRSVHGTTFDARLDGTVAKHYMVVTAPEATKWPTQEVFDKVMSLPKE